MIHTTEVTYNEERRHLNFTAFRVVLENAGAKIAVINKLGLVDATVEQSPRPSSRTIFGGFLLLTVDTRREKQTQAQHLTYFCQTHQLLWYSTRYWYPYSSRQCMDRLICRYLLHSEYVKSPHSMYIY